MYIVSQATPIALRGLRTFDVPQIIVEGAWRPLINAHFFVGEHVVLRQSSSKARECDRMDGHLCLPEEFENVIDGKNYKIYQKRL